MVGSDDGPLDILTPLPASRVKLGDGSSAVGVPVVDILKSMIDAGTDAGVVSGVVFPLPRALVLGTV